MARARNIKPSFFKNETLVELPFEHRLLFVGLWTLADKEGRLEDRPKRIKMELFPADNVDVEEGLALLERHGFISRYSAAGVDVVQVLNFAKHQSPHHTEKASELPDINGEITVKPRKQDGGNPPDSLIPDSLIPEDTGTDVPVAGTVVPACPHQAIIDLYHEHLPMGTHVRDWTPTRQKHLQARWREAKERQSLDWWAKFFAYCAESEFLTGRAPPAPGRDPFVVSLDWLITPQKFVSTIEGKYHRRAA